MARTVTSLIAGLFAAIAVNLAIMLAVNWPDVVWPPAWIYGLLTRLFVAGCVGGFLASTLARRNRLVHSILAAVPGFVTSFDWWETRDSFWLVAAIGLSGILGALTGGWLAMRMAARRSSHREAHS